MLHIHESTIRIIIVACVVLMEAMLPCYLATTILLLNFLNYITSNTYTGKALVGVSLIEMGLMVSKIHPGYISDFNITDKSLMRLARFSKKNIKVLSSKIFLVSKMFF